MQHETVIVLDFGGQYNQLIARRVRENNVYCEIYSYKTDLSVIKAKNPKGIIFTGGPNSVYLEDSPTIDPEIFNWGIPVLGICYGSQLMMHLLGGHVCRAPEREYGKTEVFVDNSSKMFEDVQPSTICWMSHNDAMALGALQSIEQAVRTVGKDIYLVGVDALKEAVQNVVDGKMTGTVLNDDVGQATKAAEATQLFVEGKDVEEYYWVDYVKVTTENAAQYL